MVAELGDHAVGVFDLQRPPVGVVCQHFGDLPQGIGGFPKIACAVVAAGIIAGVVLVCRDIGHIGPWTVHRLQQTLQHPAGVIAIGPSAAL